MEPTIHAHSPNALAEVPDNTPQSVAQELQTLQSVQHSLRNASRRGARTDYNAELAALRENLAEERLPEDMASIVEQMERLKILARQAHKNPERKADPQSPYFGHMILRDEDGQMRDILVGRATYINNTDNIRIVDWRNAPISRLFYQCRAGDPYELVVTGNTLEGDVLERRTVTIDSGQLMRVNDGTNTHVLHEGQWQTQHRPELGGGAGQALRPEALTSLRHIRRDKHLPEIASLLDVQQFELITQQDSGLIAIQGSAGSGKTTVALHRVAFLAFHNPSRFKPERTLIMVYSRALAHYISRVLPALGVEGVQVRTYEQWNATMRKRLFPKLPRVTSDRTPEVVSRFKQHALMLGLLEDARDDFEGMDVLDIFDEALTDRQWLGRAVERHAPGAFSKSELDQIHLWCATQYNIRVEGEGDNIDDVPAMDPEDDPLLLRLHQLVVGPLPGRRRRPLRYAHLVVDEAQDLSPIDLTMLLGVTARNAPVTLAGDTAQQLRSNNDFQDWAYILKHLGLPHLTISPLQISYRSTAPIMDLAHHVLGPLGPEEPPQTTRTGPAPRLFSFPGQEGAMYAFVAEALEDLMSAEPNANVAVMTRTALDADAAYRALDRAELPRLRRVADQNFSFEPGIEVTDIAQSKGLEFDYVMLLHVDEKHFPNHHDARHLLHVGITRAAHLCWLFTSRPVSPLLPKDIPQS